MKRVLATMATLLLVTAGCGGDSGDNDSAATGGDQPTPTRAEAADDGATSPTAGTSDGGAPAGSGASTATVTIGDQTYNFSTEGALVAQCQTDLFGIFSVQLPMVGGDGGIQLVILHDDTDPAVVEETNYVKVSVGDEDWMADEGSDFFDMSDKLEAGMTQVDSAEIDGSTVRGTATFVRQFSVFTGEPEVAIGNFEATCGEERIS